MSRKKQTVNMVPIANLDAQGIYQGVVHIAETKLTDEHVQVPADCDLAPNGYYWDKSAKCFVPTDEFIQQQFRIHPAAIQEG